MKFITFDELKQTYWGGNDFSDVFVSKNKIHLGPTYVVKRENDFGNFLRELNAYSMLDHPCILKLEAFCITSENDISNYLVTRRGEDIIDAYNAKKISIYQIASDLLSALSYIHELGIGHFDIKDINTIFLDGKAMLMDFGLSKRCYPYTTNRKDFYCYENVAYTPYWRDPEYSNKFNSIRQDLYALAITLYDIFVFKSKGGWRNRYTSYYPNLDLVQDQFLREFIEICVYPLRYRSSAENLLKHPIIVRTHLGIKPRQAIFINSCSMDKEKERSFKELIAIVIDLAVENNMLAKSVFLIIHLMHLSIDRLLKDYVTDPTYNITYILALFYIVSSFYSDSFDIKKAMYETFKKQVIPKNVFVFFVRILRWLNGRLDFYTYFDFAHNEDTLAVLLFDITKCNYNITMIRKFRDDEIHLDRNIEFRVIYDRALEIKDKIKPPKSRIYPIQYDEPLSPSFEDLQKMIDKTISSDKVNELDYHYLLEQPDLYKYIDEDKRKKFEEIMSRSQKSNQIIQITDIFAVDDDFDDTDDESL